MWLLSLVAAGAVALCMVAYFSVHRSLSELVEKPAAPDARSIPANAALPDITSAESITLSPAAPHPIPAVTAAAPPPAKIPSASVPDVHQQPAALLSDGILKYQKNDLDGAIADYSQALQVSPDLAAAYYYRGLARHSKAELDGAIADYNQAVLLDPRNALAFFNRGLIRMQKDDIDGAIVDSSRAIQLDPRLIQSYYDRGLGRLAKGAMDAALDDMRIFCQQAPQDAYTDYARLYIWLIQTRDGQLADANADLGKAMNSGWNGTPDSMVTRLGEYLLGQISESELIKNSASAIPVKDQGQRCEAWYFIGMRKLVEGDREAAVEALRKCVATQKTDYCEYILAQEQLRTLSGFDQRIESPLSMRSD